MKHYRILENGNQFWTGRAHDVDHALEKCYDDGGPGSMVDLVVEWYNPRARLTSSIRGGLWCRAWAGNIPMNPT